MKYSDKLDFLEGRLAETGKADKPLLEQPELTLALNAIWEGFWFLSPSRPVGFAAGAIPLSEIVVYWRDLRGVRSQDDLERCVELVRRLDTAFLTHHAEQQRQKDALTKKK